MPTAWLNLPTPLILPGLFLRAAPCCGIYGRVLPERGPRSQIAVDPKHLGHYRQVCGFRDGDLLPPTCPHILAFPLQMTLLTDKRFPFPLPGLVHLESHVDVLCALDGLGPFIVSVAVKNPRPHDKSTTFSITTRLEGQLGLFQVDDSRVPCRGVKVPGKIPPKAEQEPLPLEPVDNWKTSADVGRHCARAAGDCNPIHLSASSTKLFDFPHAIARGLWNKAHSLTAPSKRLPASGYWVEVRFQEPVLLPASLTLLASAAAADGQSSLRGKGGLPHIAGRQSRLRG